MANVTMSAGKVRPGSRQTGFKGIVYFICIVAALGGLLFGLDQGFIANSLETIVKVYNLDLSMSEYYSSILATGGVIGALLSGFFARMLGRKKSLVFAGFLFSAASVVSATLPSFEVLSGCRLALGFAVGVASFVVPLYLSETAPAQIRGAMGTLFQLLITVGIFLISLVNVFIARLLPSPTTALPVMFLVVGAFSLLMFCGALILPESPRWLMLKGKRARAEQILARTLNTKEDVDFEIREIEATLQSAAKQGKSPIFKGYFIKVLLVGVLLQMFQQLVGINVMIYYAPRIFGYAGLTGLLAMMTVPTVNMLFTFPAIKWVEKWGRKRLLIVGAVVMLVAMLAAGIAFSTISGLPEGAPVGMGVKVTLLLSAVVYIFGFAVSWGPVAWLVCSEIFPLEGREVGMTVTTMVNWTFAGLVMDNALTFMHDHGNASIFFLFSAFCVLAMIFVHRFVPETKGVTLEEIEASLKAGKPLRNIGS